MANAWWKSEALTPTYQNFKPLTWKLAELQPFSWTHVKIGLAEFHLWSKVAVRKVATEQQHDKF